MPQRSSRVFSLRTLKPGDFFSHDNQQLHLKPRAIQSLLKIWWQVQYLPPAYVVRREGNSFTLFVCPHLGGGGSSPGGGGQVSEPMGGGGGAQVQLAGGGGQVQQGGGVRSVRQRGGVRSSRWWGGVRSSQLGGRGGQHLAPSCGRYASCVHAGGLSCLRFIHTVL